MTRYTAVWDTDVKSQFVGAWIAGESHTRAVLTEIANYVDANLADDPDLKGEPRDDLGVRILALPLATTSARVSVAYQIRSEDRQVRVVRLVIRGG